MQAVVYDRQGANYCGRLWWMLKWAGHDAVAVLDGGLQAWQAAGGAVASGDEPAHFQSNFSLHTPLRRLVTASEVLQNLQQPTQTVVDARATPRYRGETEPLDPWPVTFRRAEPALWPEPGFRRPLQARSIAARRVR